MALSRKQKMFVAAFLGSARRNASVAAVMAGINIPAEGAKALVEHPEIKAELERLNMKAIVVDGELIDVEPGDLDPMRKFHRNGRNKLLVSMPNPDNAPPTLLERLGGKKKKESLESIAENLPEGTIITEDGAIAGTADETFRRINRINIHDGHLQSVKTSSPQLQAMLEKKYEDMQKENIARTAPDGTLRVTTKVKTRFEIKEFFSKLVDDERLDAHTRMTAAVALGRTLGMFNERIIEREYNRESEAAGGGDKEALQKRLEEAKALREKLLAVKLSGSK